MAGVSGNPLRVLMLGWEYPPHIAGGLGVACEGLTKALGKISGLEIHFIVPKLLGGEEASHMFLHDSFRKLAPPVGGNSTSHYEMIQSLVSMTGNVCSSKSSGSTAVSSYSNPRDGSVEAHSWITNIFTEDQRKLQALFANSPWGISDDETDISSNAHYGRNVFEEVARYTSRVIRNFGGFPFDIIHAHDWMTFPAGVALQRLTGKPLVVHTHSIDFDRSGTNRNDSIFQIEHLGIHAANRVISVSHYTKDLVAREYGISHDKIAVVHNGIYQKRKVAKQTKSALTVTKQVLPSRTNSKSGSSKLSKAPVEIKDAKVEAIEQKRGTVLFLGRVTMQKGPDYYVRAAAKVVAAIPHARFFLAGKGDLLPGMIELAHDLGIGDRFEFLGFLNEAEVEEAFAEADLYVMPSVSEPFGISALEAINFDTPVIMSRQSGVSEVVLHSLKFDFWDVDRLADLIINGLLHEELRADMISFAKSELERLRWDAAAVKTKEVYCSILPGNQQYQLDCQALGNHAVNA